MEKKSKKQEEQKEQESVISEDIKEIPMEDIKKEIDYILHEGNYRYEVLGHFTLIRSELKQLNDSVVKLGKIMEDMLEVVTPDE